MPPISLIYESAIYVPGDRYFALQYLMTLSFDIHLGTDLGTDHSQTIIHLQAWVALSIGRGNPFCLKMGHSWLFSLLSYF